ncbi:MAG: hypothetical protein CL795_00085 [Chloroflexi bacterium]|nr:hypothetical protein [Chloroflexota bacterium]
MKLIINLLAVVSFSVLLIACMSPTGLATGTSDDNSSTNTDSVATQIIANEISDLSSNANVLEQNQEVIVDSLTQIATIQSEQEDMMEQMEDRLAALYGVEKNMLEMRVNNTEGIDLPEEFTTLDTKMEFLEELVVGQIADSALVTNEALSEITKVEQDITNALESEIKSIRDESEKANEKALKISEESNKEIEIINRKIIDLSNDTSNVDLFKEINDLKIQIEIKNDQIANLELENKKLSEKLSDFIFHYNTSNQMNKYNE